MADVGTILNSGGQDSWYDPAQDYSGPMPEGEYKAHVKSLSVKRNIVVKSKFLSDIYEITLRLLMRTRIWNIKTIKENPLVVLHLSEEISVPRVSLDLRNLEKANTPI